MFLIMLGMQPLISSLQSEEQRNDDAESEEEEEEVSQTE